MMANGTAKSNVTKLLCGGGSLAASPVLAKKIGLNEAIAIQQIHYLLVEHAKPENDHNYFDGRWWIYKSYEDWSEAFPYWSRNTIRRILQNLESLRLVLVVDRQVAGGNHVNYYSVDYDAVENAVAGKVSVHRIPSELPQKTEQKGSVAQTEEDAQNGQAGMPKMGMGDAQNGHALYKVVNKTSLKEYKENLGTTDAESASQGQDRNSFYSSQEENPKPLAPSKEKNGLPYLRTRPEDLNTPRDPLYSALDLICRGNGTGSDKFVETLRELNRYSLHACDLDEMAKMIREERGFKHLSPGHFTYYVSIYVAEKEKQDDELRAAALRRQRQEERDRQQDADLEAYRKQAMADLPARQEARKRKEEEDRRAREEEDRVRFEKRMAGRKDSLGAFSLSLELLPKPLEQLSDEEFILFLRPHRQAAARQLMARASPQMATMGGATA